MNTISNWWVLLVGSALQGLIIFQIFAQGLIYFIYIKTSASICRRLSLGLVTFSYDHATSMDRHPSIVTIALTKKVF